MLHEPVVLFRYFNLETKEEQTICAKHFKTVQSRSDAENIKNKIVIGRYSVLPFYKELENDLSYFNSKLINSLVCHLLVEISKTLKANLFSKFTIDKITELSAKLSKLSHSNDKVDGVTILTTSLLTIHFNFGSETCSTIATLYQAWIKIGKYLSFA